MAVRKVSAIAGLLLVMAAAPTMAATLDEDVDSAKSLALAGNTAAAEAICNTVIAAHPGAPVEPRARLVLGHILIRRKAAVSDIVQAFLATANQFPGAPEAREALLRVGYLRVKTNEQPEEWNRLQKDYAQSQEAAEAMHCLGHLALKAGDTELATKRFKDSAASPAAAASVVEESQVEAGYSYISSYWRTSDRSYLAQAVEHFQSITQPLDNDNAVKVKLGLGEACLIRGFGYEAAAHYQAALELHPQDPFLQGLATFELGCALYCKKDWFAAESAFSSFIDSQPGENMPEKDQLWKTARPGYAELSAARPADAGKLAALDLIPEALYWRARTLFELQRYQESGQLADSFIASFPSHAMVAQANSLSRMCADATREAK